MKERVRALVRTISPITMGLLVVLLGCQPSRPRTNKEVFDGNFDALARQFGSPSAEVPQEILDKVPVYLASLKPGMSPREVLRTLRLSKVQLVGGDHAPWAYDLGFKLRSNCYMSLRFNMLSNPPSFIQASLSGDGWKQSPTNGLSR
ncbi:MAG: hypothetical protein NT154_31975 [Verrucomicrobia bacterium]|nr:hypothetical protein [Verrucomicrobiota bacterium]